MVTIIDTHAHLYDLTDPAATLRDCAAAGVSDVVALGVDLASNKKHLEIGGKQEDGRRKIGAAGREPHRSSIFPLPASIFPRVHIALGLHPGNITTPADTEVCFAFMREHIHNAIAIGETGLDFWYKWVRKDETKQHEQRAVFDRHLALAKEFDLPVVIHSRGAWRECLEMTRAAGITKAEFHWYSGPLDVLKDILDAGFYISCTPALSGSPQLRDAVALAPLERIMIETDTPVAYRTSANSGAEAVASTPKDVWTTLKLLAEIKGRPQEDVLAVVNQNARDFFGF